MKFIFTADLHLRTDVPICRKETESEWLETQRMQLEFIANLAFTENCPVFIGGDIFHKPNVTDEIKNMFINTFAQINVYAIAGQHDLPNHQWENVNRSSFGVLRNSGVLKPLSEFGMIRHFGQELVGKDTGLVFIHDLVFENNKSIPPNVRAKTAEQILEEYPDAKWVICGDQHHSFHYKKQGRHVLMSGCFNRQAADFLNYTPAVWLIDSEANTAMPFLVPDDVNLVTDEHIQVKNDRSERICAFITMVKDSKSISLDFENNVRQAIAENSDMNVNTLSVVEELMG